jgi:hypothetical protein
MRDGGRQKGNEWEGRLFPPCDGTHLGRNGAPDGKEAEFACLSHSRTAVTGAELGVDTADVRVDRVDGDVSDLVVTGRMRFVGRNRSTRSSLGLSSAACGSRPRSISGAGTPLSRSRTSVSSARFAVWARGGSRGA